ncbi:photosystem II reaction center protein Psb28 [Spirulina major CS-329]|nr:photosystem II reaction center protein Psb28 [Spirulina major]MDB9494221.1 photosystem II reaction center protein Psb28 [Spirulina subsalsa CS-330]MDB9503049.1 photosystem II reaction center protein Psb28 [Spirulina major CS-329]
MEPRIEFFEGIPETLTNIRLRQGKTSGIRNILLEFETLQAVDLFNSFTKRFTGTVHLIDEEGEINATPSSFRFRVSPDEEDDILGADCQIDIESPQDWDRVMRFLERYAEANGMGYEDR